MTRLTKDEMKVFIQIAEGSMDSAPEHSAARSNLVIVELLYRILETQNYIDSRK